MHCGVSCEWHTTAQLAHCLFPVSTIHKLVSCQLAVLTFERRSIAYRLATLSHLLHLSSHSMLHTSIMVHDDVTTFIAYSFRTSSWLQGHTHSRRNNISLAQGFKCPCSDRLHSDPNDRITTTCLCLPQHLQAWAAFNVTKASAGYIVGRYSQSPSSDLVLRRVHSQLHQHTAEVKPSRLCNWLCTSSERAVEGFQHRTTDASAFDVRWANRAKFYITVHCMHGIYAMHTKQASWAVQRNMWATTQLKCGCNKTATQRLHTHACLPIWWSADDSLLNLEHLRPDHKALLTWYSSWPDSR